MKFLIIGCGSIGKRHARNLLNLGQDVSCFDTSESTRKEVEEVFSIRTFSNLDRALGDELTAAFICTPTNMHVRTSLKAAKRGLHLFIEKPLSHNLNNVNELIQVVDSNDLITLVGCNMRFHEGIQTVKSLLEKNEIGKPLFARVQSGSYLPDWHPNEDYRNGYSANRSMGGGILLDGIHEVDYLRWFFGDANKVSCFAKKLSSLEIDVEDVSEILIEYEKDIIAEVHLDYVQRKYNRTCQVVGDKGNIEWDINENAVKLYTASKAKEETINLQKTENNAMYVKEAEHFINCIKGVENTMQDIKAGKKALEAVLAAKESNRLGEAVFLK